MKGKKEKGTEAIVEKHAGSTSDGGPKIWLVCTDLLAKSAEHTQ